MYFVKDGIKSIKVNASRSGLNKKVEAVWSYMSSSMRKSLIFNANVIHQKSIKAEEIFQTLVRVFHQGFQTQENI
jgi:hypothetical protein